MGSNNYARLYPVEGREAILFATSAIVRFPELAPHADEAIKLCKIVEGMFRDSGLIGVKFLGSMCFKDMVAEHTDEKYVEAATASRPDAILIAGWTSPDHTRQLPTIVNALGTLSAGYIEANRIATTI